MNGEPMSEHTDVGAYALGLLEPRDRQAFEEHLAGCPACAAELAELSGMKSLLSDLGPVEAPADEPTEANVTDLVRRRAESQRRHTRRQVLLGAAAGVALLAGGAAVGVAVAGQPASQVSQNAGRTVSAVDQQTGVHGTATLVAKPFGTQVTVDLAHIQGGLTPSTYYSRAGPPSSPATCRGSTSSPRATALRSALRSEDSGRRSPDHRVDTAARADSACS